MTETETGQLLLDLAILFALTYLLGVLLARVRVPRILGAIFVAMGAYYTPLGTRLQAPAVDTAFSFLADLGVLLLLFFIGLQIDIKAMRRQSGDIVWLTVLNTSFPFLLGALVMRMMGYGWTLAFVVGLTRMPTAEAVIVPILDEFNLIRTRVGNFVVGAGVLDDVIEVFMVAFVSVWIGERTMTAGDSAGLIEHDLVRIALGIAVFVLVAWLAHRWLLPWAAKIVPQKQRNLVMMSILVLFGIGGLSELASLSMVVGAITAGILLRPIYDHMSTVGEVTTATMRAVVYGFFGPVFFFWVGLSVDLGGMFREPLLAVLLFGAAVIGKLIGVFLMVPMRKLSMREAWVVGVGINARLTTEIIVAKLLLDAELIDTHLFTALVAASSLSTVLVPLVFSYLVSRWGPDLKGALPARAVEATGV